MKKPDRWKKRYLFPFCYDVFLKKYIPLFLLLIFAVPKAVFSQTTVATLPFELKINGSASLKNVDGLKCASSLDFFYAGDGSVRFSTQSDYMIVRFDIPAQSVTLKKTTGGTGSVFHLSGSVDGTNYESIEDLTVTSSNTQLLTTTCAIDGAYRYLRIGYTKSSNVGISLLQIEPGNTAIQEVYPPVFSLSEGSYIGPQTVHITAETGNSVYYTLDGTVPTSHTLHYTGEGIEIDHTLQLQAIAYNAENQSSTVAQATYTILSETQESQCYRTAFRESFDQNSNSGGNDSKWNGSIASSLSAETDREGWVFQNGFSASACILLGTSSQGKGTAITPVLGIEGNARLRFKAGAWNTANEITNCTLKISNTAGRLAHPSVSNPAQTIVLTLQKGQFDTYEVEITGAIESSSKITFSAEPTGSRNARFFLDEVTVYAPLEEFSTHYPVAALSGRWDPETLSETPDLVSEISSTVLKINRELILFDDFVVDNVSGNPNLIVYTPMPVVTLNAINAVNGSINGKAELKDQHSLEVTEDLSGEVSLTRFFSGTHGEDGGWQSICLPFTVDRLYGNNAEYIPYAEWILTQPKDKGFFWLKTTDIHAITNTIDADASTIQAHIPYIIAFPNYGYTDYPLLTIQDAVEFTFYGEGILSTEKATPLDMKDWLFQPTYQSLETENCYVLNPDGNQFERMHADNSLQMIPFHPYLIYKGSDQSAAPQLFKLQSGNLNTGLADSINPSEDLIIHTFNGGISIYTSCSTDLSIYCITGQQVKRIEGSTGIVSMDLLPGIYYVNGQKVAVY